MKTGKAGGKQLNVKDDSVSRLVVSAFSKLSI